MSWKPEVDQIEERQRRAQELGGPDAVARQHERGRLTVRERVDRLVDAGSFREEGPIAGSSEVDDQGRLIAFSGANYILGVGHVDGRACVIGGEDFTQRGGSPSPAGLRKSVFAEELACRLRLPLIRFLEGGGGSVRGTQKSGARGSGAPAPRPAAESVSAPPRFLSIARMLDTAPVVSAALGAVAGFPAARLVASHFSVMARDTAQILIGGPALVERALGEKLTKEELGGARIHARSGVVDNVAADEDEVMEQIRRFLSYLPPNVWCVPPRVERDDDPERCEASLLEIVPRERRQVYDMRKLVRAVVDRESFFELRRGYGRGQITGLARLDGTPVGVLANDPRVYAGAMGAEEAQKLRRFVELCETFHLPVVCFVDEPGFMIGSASEKGGTIRYGMEAIATVVQSSVPWASVHVRKAYGVAAAAHFGPEATVFAWPSAESGALPLEGGIAVAFRREIAEAPDPDKLRAELEERFAAGRSPFPRAEAYGVHDLIDPRRTRPALCGWLDTWHGRIDEHAAARRSRDGLG